jgi:nicotinate-nucleotide adenylyltransferase
MAHAIGIMGGTFDPIHYGHLAAAEEARLRFALDHVVFVPNRQPPHKKDYCVTAAEDRYAMVVLATASHPQFEVSRVELDRPGPSYTVDTLREFRSQVGPDARIYFITGADAIFEILTWRSPHDLARSCEFIAVARPGYDLQRLTKEMSDLLHGRAHILNVPGVAVSSTEIRRRAADGESLRYLVPPAVARYVEVNRLYLQRDAAHSICGGPAL